MDFPQYRKLSNDRSFYRINSNDSFDELQVMGEHVFLHCIQADKYPEKLRIMEMLDCVIGYEVSSLDEWGMLEKRLK
jgi:hypothetical protein